MNPNLEHNYKECIKHQKLPFKITKQNIDSLKNSIKVILRYKCYSPSHAYMIAGIANALFYTIKTHKMPKTWVSGPYYTKGCHVLKHKHFKVYSY